MEFFNLESGSSIAANSAFKTYDGFCNTYWKENNCNPNPSTKNKLNIKLVK